MLILSCRLANSDMPNALEIYLMSCGQSLDFDAKNKAGLTPLQVAANSAFSSCLTLLKKYSCNGAKTEDLNGTSANGKVRLLCQYQLLPQKRMNIRQLPGVKWEVGLYLGGKQGIEPTPFAASIFEDVTVPGRIWHNAD